jgi:hypothetical protein
MMSGHQQHTARRRWQYFLGTLPGETGSTCFPAPTRPRVRAAAPVKAGHLAAAKQLP